MSAILLRIKHSYGIFLAEFLYLRYINTLALRTIHNKKGDRPGKITRSAALRMQKRRLG